MTIRLTLLFSAILLGACATVEERFELGQGSFPTTAVDPSSGTTYWSWFGEEAGRPVVYATRLAADSRRPDPPVNVSGGFVSANPHAQAPAQVAVAPDGTVYVVWSTRTEIPGRRFPASDVVIARSVDGGKSFERPVFVNDDHGGPPSGHTFHDVAVGSDGVVYVSWLDSRNDPGDAAHAGHASASDDGGGAHAEHPASHTDVRVARSTDGGRTFAPGIVVARSVCQCCRTALEVDGGSVYVAWRHIFGANVRDITVARSDDGGRTFSDPVRVHEDAWEVDGCPHAGPSLEMDDGGSLHIAWYTAANEQGALYHAVSTDHGRTFGAVQSIQPNVPVASARLSVGNDSLYVAWENPRNREIRLAWAKSAGVAQGVRPAGAAKGVQPAGAAWRMQPAGVAQTAQPLEGGEGAQPEDSVGVVTPHVQPGHAFRGENPAIDAYGDLLSLTWSHEGRIEALVVRP